MDQYIDTQKLVLKEKVYVTKEVKQLLKRVRNKYRKEGRQISMSKLVCNLIIKEYGNNQ